MAELFKTMLTPPYSQSGQDLWVDAILKEKRNGLFLDVGCNHPTEISNTFALEAQRGWKGLLLDRDDYCINLCLAQRTSKVLHADGLTCDWHGLLTVAGLIGEPIIDYLSVDCDENTAATLERLFPSVSPTRFRVMTVEHDMYRAGAHVRDKIDAIVENHGYEIICRNVRASDGSIYESWACDPDLVDMDVARRYKSDGMIWSDILKL